MEKPGYRPDSEVFLRRVGPLVSFALLATLAAPVASVEFGGEGVVARAPVQAACIPEKVQTGPDTRPRIDPDQ